MAFLLDERYEVSDRRIGGGAFGDIWLGRDRRTGSEVAVKIAGAPSAEVSDLDIDEAFNREKLALSKIRHPNVVGLLHSGWYQDRRFLVLEYVGDSTLWNVIEEDRRKGEERKKPKLLTSDKIRILCDVSRALGKVHSAGFVHLDVKPENVLLALDGRAVLIDFGSSLTMEEAKHRPVEIETTAYCAPEQVQGSRWCDPQRGLTPRTDVFAFGIVAWELLSLQRPFGEANSGLLTRIANENPRGSLAQMAPDCPAEVVSLIGTCLNKNPQSRYQSMAAVNQRIEYAAALDASQTLQKQGRREEALNKAEEAIAIYPDQPEARNLAFAYSLECVESLVKSGDAERAREYLQRAGDYCGGDAQRLGQIDLLKEQINTRIFNDKQIRSWVKRAIEDRNAGNLSAAAEYLAMAENLDPQHPALQDYHGARRQQQSSEIEELLRVPDYPGALALWKSMFEESQGSEILGATTPELERLRKKIWKQAESDIEEALFIDDFAAAGNLSDSLSLGAGGDEESQSFARKLSRIVDERKTVYASTAHLAALNEMAEGRYEEALTLVRNALNVLPDDSDLLAAESSLVGELSEARKATSLIRQKIQAKMFDDADRLIEDSRASNRLPADVLNEFEAQLRLERTVASTILQCEHFAADGSLDEALELVNRALKDYPANLPLLKTKSQLEAQLEDSTKNSLAGQIADALQRGDLDQASMGLRLADARYPRDPRFMALAGKVQDAEQRRQEGDRREQEAQQEAAERDRQAQQRRRDREIQEQNERRERAESEKRERRIQTEKRLPEVSVPTEPDNAQRITEALVLARGFSSEGKFDKAKDVLENGRRSIADAPELRDALLEIAAAERLQGQEAAPIESGFQRLLENQQMLAVVVGAVLLLGVVIGVWLWKKPPTPQPDNDIAKTEEHHDSIPIKSDSIRPKSGDRDKPVSKTDLGFGGKPSSGQPPPVKLPAEIVFFNADHPSIAPGGKVRLSWQINHAAAIYISPGVGSVKASDSAEVTPTADTTYTLTAVGEDKVTVTKEAPVVVVVAKQPPPVIPRPAPKLPTITSFNASPSTVRQGDPTTLSWTTTNAKSVTIQGPISVPNLPANGSQQVWPQKSQGYMLSVLGEEGSAESPTFVTVVPAQPKVPPNDASGVRATLNRFTDACDRNDMNAMWQVYPSPTAVARAYYRQHCAPGPDKIRIVYESCDTPNISADQATIACSRVVTYQAGQKVIPTPVLVTLKKGSGGSWEINGETKR